MAKDITVILEDRPGTLADLGEVLGKAGINIDGFCAHTYEGKGGVHILVEDDDGARRAIEGAGMQVSAERDVLIIDAENQPGMLGKVARKIADEGVNIELIYKATQTKIVIGVSDMEKVRGVV